MSGELKPENEPSTSKPPEPIQRETNWPTVLFYIYLHMCALFALVLVFTEARIYTTLFSESFLLNLLVQYFTVKYIIVQFESLIYPPQMYFSMSFDLV